MSYAAIAKNVVEDSLHSVVIIDDTYVDLCTSFADTGDHIKEMNSNAANNLAESVQLCRGFQKSRMAYRIVTYSNKRTPLARKRYLNDIVRRAGAADLLVLDWQLESAPNYGMFASQLVQRIASEHTLNWI